MKLKWLALFGALLATVSTASLSLSGCSGCASKDTLSGVSSSQVSSVPEDDGPKLDKNIAMETETESLSNGNITLNYPVLVKMDHRAKQQSLNDVLLHDAKAAMATRIPAGSSGIMDVTEGYHTREYLSFVSIGSFITPSSTSPTMSFYVSNLNLQTGKRFVTPIREHAQELAKTIRSGDGYTVLTPSDDLRKQQENYLKSLSEETLTSLLSACDYTDNENDTAPQCFSYPLGENHYAIYLPVPSNLTGYAMIQIRLGEPTVATPSYSQP